MIMAIITAARRALAKFRIRSLEIQLHGMNDAMQLVTDEETRIAISLARHQVRRDLTEARSAYIKLLPPGERRTWSVA